MKINDKRNTIRKHPTKKPSTRTLNQITHIAIHHSLTTTGSAEAFANYHVGTKGWSRMGYSYVINRDGSIDWCADYTVVTPHVGNHNRYSLGICMVGDFRTQSPNKEQYESLLWLVNHVQDNLPNDCSVVGHSEYSGYEWKSCPVIDMNKVRLDVANYNKPEYPLVNVIFEDKSVTALNINGQSMVQIRDLANLMSVQIGYDKNTKQVTFNNHLVDPLIINGRSYLHIREAASIANLLVGWNGNTKTVILSRR